LSKLRNNLITVLLPAPLGPSRSIVPSLIWKATELRAAVMPHPFVSSLVSRMIIVYNEFSFVGHYGLSYIWETIRHLYVSESSNT